MFFTGTYMGSFFTMYMLLYVLRYISEGRFELVSGGWVMPDEAASNYFALVDQLIEGHNWIRENIGE